MSSQPEKPMSDPAVEALLALIASKRQDVDQVLDVPSWVVWTFVLDTIGQFVEWTGKHPKQIYLTRTQHILLNAYASKHMGVKDADEKLLLMGMKIVSDARMFALE